MARAWTQQHRGEHPRGFGTLGFSMCTVKARTKNPNYFLPLHQNCLSKGCFPSRVNSCFPNAAFTFELLPWWSSLRQQSWTFALHRKELYVTTVLISANNGWSRPGKIKGTGHLLVILFTHSCIWLVAAFCCTLGHVCFAMLKTWGKETGIMALTVQL